MQARGLIAATAGAVALMMPATAYGGHGLGLLDHEAPGFPPPAVPIDTTFMSGGPDAEWEFVSSIPTGNLHTDIDFFTQTGNTYMSAGTLGFGPNVGGQTIVQLTSGGELQPQFLAGHPSGACGSNPADITGLQHDVEATPKGGALLNAPNPHAVRSDTQLLLDATDAPGRCHDQGTLGLSGAPQGGLEIVDVTNPGAPKEIGLVSHTGESHTVNVDPKRPHIAYSVTSDSVNLNPDGSRQNEDPADSERFNLDGFEVVDFSSCMNFPAGTSIDEKRAACRPKVYRYRWSSADIALGHTLQNTIWGCHELEVYPDDTLTCGAGAALIELDMSGAFNDNGTPTDFTDDKPRGTPLPCKMRASSSAPPFGTTAMVTDCVDGENDAGGPGGLSPTQDLTIPGWIAQGSPSLEGVRYVGTIHHQGRAATGELAPFNSDEDIDFNHEAELSGSGNLLIATDERGGGILPPGATCFQGPGNPQGNGGVHFFKRSALHQGPPGTAEQEQTAYARTPDGNRAIFRVPIRTQPRATVCTAHVFHQIPGQNRIFMAWYSQGTHVIDYLERPDGTVEFKEAGWFIPGNANEWVSAAFNCQKNADGTFTYDGATGDFNLGEAGRNAIDMYRVTLPPAPTSGPSSCQGAGGDAYGGAGAGAGKVAAPHCSNVIMGKRKKDKIRGTSFGDTIRSKAGNDRIKAGLGDDCTIDGKGKDVSRGQQGNDLMKPGKGRDRVFGGPGNDKIRVGGAGRDRVSCGAGRDVVKVDKRDRVKGCEKIRGKRRR